MHESVMHINVVITAGINFRMMDMFRISKENGTNNHINHFIFGVDLSYL